jgi:hypothetical protein
MAAQVWHGACSDGHGELGAGEGCHVAHAVAVVGVGKAVEGGQDVVILGTLAIGARADRVDAGVDVALVFVHGDRVLRGFFDVVVCKPADRDLPAETDAAQLKLRLFVCYLFPSVGDDAQEIGDL